ncbi:hypothetical protein [Dickeya fangzhongdai]|uniref:Uncharacterized protein n=1 Tax=Dickeya fangzhongdai TaxID=1778540 RepID=A0A2K8QQU3_9GAMM|nr:hypothetical protein [Dickeya fangzhongdai]ATZ95877.1 hypothetical protein CVE23_19015 [Dickeya fangzhongdai]QOH49320.1 hypothetical protein DYD82_19090 [Dickeya fangzhongdai]QOH53624.1 hypothetical protein DYD83_19090 [Dickeya fangzhongdai]WOX99174.1 hypothetical protein OGM22_16200 [Dickeya fangzhongdai]WOY05674.1 hypothetical protein OGM21_06225 [Dickeya fangzhongdai]
MKKIACTSLLIALLASLQSKASISLVKNEDQALSNEVVKYGNARGVVDIKSQSEQSFDIIEDGKYIGTIVPAKGFHKNYYPLCFIGWSTDKKTISDIVPSIGQGSFELSLCSTLDGVGKIEEKERTFIGFVYTVGLRDRYAQNYFLIELNKGNKTIEDKSQLIERFQNDSEKKSIADLRKDIKKIDKRKQ